MLFWLAPVVVWLNFDIYAEVVGQWQTHKEIVQWTFKIQILDKFLLHFGLLKLATLSYTTVYEMALQSYVNILWLLKKAERPTHY